MINGIINTRDTKKATFPLNTFIIPKINAPIITDKKWIILLILLSLSKKTNAENEIGSNRQNVAEIKQVFFKPQTVSLSTVTISGTKLNEYADIIKDEKHVEKLFFEFLEAYRKNSVQQVH